MLNHVRGNWVARLRRFAETSPPGRERCELCGALIGASHQHVLELETRSLLCACQPCSIALAESGRFRLVEPSIEALADFHLSDCEWEAMQLPIDLVFLFLSTPEGGPVALYPGSGGATASTMSREAWSRLAAANPILETLSPDVEALLINRVRGARGYYRVSIDRCFALVGLIRSQWRGLSGGSQVWEAIAHFFAALDADDHQSGMLAHG
ncbi:MAG TPA: DUF5947 family protein [Methylocystis sp.]|nr:DUF5947 family protein [Methylocystis sp.]